MTSLLFVKLSSSFLIAVGPELGWPSEWTRQFAIRQCIQRVLERSKAIVR